MLRNIALGALAAAMLVCLPAQAQEGQELEGAPGYRSAEQDAARKAEAQKKAAQQAAQKQAQTAADKIKAEQAKLAQQTEAQKAEQARLARQAAELKAQQARLDARAAELAAEEKRLAQLRIDQEAAAARLADLTRQRDEAAREAALRSQRETQTADLSRDTDSAASDEIPPLRTTPAPSRAAFARLDFGAARRSCTRAAEDEVRARDFYSAEYDSAPRFVQGDAWEVRGRMRLEDRRGYLIVDTICEVDADGEARDFIFLR
ncbi:MAG: hypothetical protein Q8R02_02515 [Hyphomonadaceae bacterium]|nr:hypothetical protein [Hyphomonadaceae bacterium]